MADEITFYTTGEWCPICEHENEITLDYREVVKMHKGDPSANLPLVHCSNCGNRLAPCSLCTDALRDGYITFNEMNCDNCPITKFWNAKYGEDKHGEEKEIPMTEEKKTPSFEDIQKSFFEKCQLHQKRYPDSMPCPHCEYKCLGSDWRGECNGSLDSQGSCERHYIYEVAAYNRPIDKPLWNPPKVELPEWCKVGAWVMDDGDLTLITEIDHAYIWGKVADRDVFMMQPVDRARELKPIKFRPYESLEELGTLLGKKLRFKREVMGGGSTAVEIITSVEYDSFDGAMNINLRPYSFYTKEVEATIDGLPIGVPVVDE